MAMPNQWVSAQIVYGSDQKAPFINTAYYVPTALVAAVVQATAQQVADQLFTLFSAVYVNWLCQQSNFYSVKVSYHDAGLVWNATSSQASLTGNTISDELPDYSAALLRKQSTQPGIRGRGRLYVGCVPETFTDTSKLLLLGVSTLQSIGDAFTSFVAVGPDTYHPYHHSPKDDDLYDLIGCTAGKVLSTQRRRRLRQGQA